MEGPAPGVSTRAAHVVGLARSNAGSKKLSGTVSRDGRFALTLSRLISLSKSESGAEDEVGVV